MNIQCKTTKKLFTEMKDHMYHEIKFNCFCEHTSSNETTYDLKQYMIDEINFYFDDIAKSLVSKNDDERNFLTQHCNLKLI